MVKRLGVEEQGTANQSAWSQNATADRSVQRERTWEGMVEVVEIVSVSGVHLDLAGMMHQLFPFYIVHWYLRWVPPIFLSPPAGIPRDRTTLLIRRY